MRTTLLAVALGFALPALVVPASADPVLCQKTILKQYTVLKKKTLKGVEIQLAGGLRTRRERFRRAPR